MSIFFYRFLNWFLSPRSVSLTPVLMDTAVVHPKDGSRSRLIKGWDAAPPVSGCSRQGGGSSRRKNTSDPMIATWTWWCSECADVLCAPVCVCQSQHREELFQAREMTLELVQVHAEPWHWVPPGVGTFLWDTTLGNVLFPVFSFPALSSFCACPPESNPSTGLLSPERQIVGLSVRLIPSSLTSSSPITSYQT